MMEAEDPDRYVCPALAGQGPDDCPTPPLDAEFLDRLVEHGEVILRRQGNSPVREARVLLDGGERPPESGGERR